MQTNNLTVRQKGRFGERLVECYINDELIPSLKTTEGWTDIIYTVAWFKSTHCSDYPESIAKFEEEREVRILLSSGYYPTKEFHDYFKKLTFSLCNMPDGFLIKMKRTGTSKSVKEAIEEFDITSTSTFEDNYGNLLLELPEKNKVLPVVKGKIEVVEVKTGVGNQLQVESYRNSVAHGYPLRLFKVDLNVPEIMEKVIVNPNEVVLNCFKDMSTFTKR
jgi:hypothetical protein